MRVVPAYTKIEKAALVASPIVFGIVTLIHPVVRGDVVESLGSRTTVWLAVHVAQIPLIIGAGVALALVTKDLHGRATTVSRGALVVFVAFYSAFDAVVGIATGLLIRTSAVLPAAAEAARALWSARFKNPWVGAIIIPGDVAWVVAAVAAAIAVRQARGPRLAVAALLLSAVFFGVDHAPPVGPVGMAALAVAAWSCTAWREAFRS